MYKMAESLNITRTLMKEMIHEIDANGDGKISSKEWID